MIQANIEIPSGVFIFEDPPLHTAHRGLLSRVFTPRQMNAFEPQIREFCARALDPLVGSERFDFVRDLGAIMPMSVIGMMLGIPEADQQAVREHKDSRMRDDTVTDEDHAFADETFFADYIDWRAEHPSDDLMTQLLQVEFEDPSGTVRTLTRDEVLIFINILAVAGNETTNRLIGWTGKVLGDHPDQRRELHDNRELIPNAIEEILRYEPPAHQLCRYVTRDVEYYGETVPEGSVMMFIAAAANRDHRVFPPDGDVFDIHRSIAHHRASGTASTSASVPRSRGSRAASPSTRYSTGSPTGRSTPTPRCSTSRECAAGRPCRRVSADRRRVTWVKRCIGCRHGASGRCSSRARSRRWSSCSTRSTGSSGSSPRCIR